MTCNESKDDRKALAVAGAFILVCLMAWLFTGCSSTPTVVPDPCDGCPFTERLVEVWSPPALDPIPGYPGLTAQTFTAEQIETDPAAYIRELIADRVILKASVVEHHHWAESIVQAIKESEATRPD